MSEYHDYELRAVDTPERRATETAACDLRESGDEPEEVCQHLPVGRLQGQSEPPDVQRFDAFLYWANWGAQRFQARLPDSLASLKRIKPYCVGPCVNDLRDLAMRDKREADFRFGLRTIREEHANKPSFQRRLNEGRLAR